MRRPWWAKAVPLAQSRQQSSPASAIAQFHIVVHTQHSGAVMLLHLTNAFAAPILAATISADRPCRHVGGAKHANGRIE